MRIVKSECLSSRPFTYIGQDVFGCKKEKPQQKLTQQVNLLAHVNEEFMGYVRVAPREGPISLYLRVTSSPSLLTNPTVFHPQKGNQDQPKSILREKSYKRQNIFCLFLITLDAGLRTWCLGQLQPFCDHEATCKVNKEDGRIADQRERSQDLDEIMELLYQRGPVYFEISHYGRLLLKVLLPGYFVTCCPKKS